MKRACELCKAIARIHCESDQASLCWNCDAKVHSANFLVARHSRNLLCRVCQSATPWSAAGSVLEPTFSVCRQCVDGRICDESREEDKEEAPEEIEENQIATWSPPPALAAESSSSGEDTVCGGKVVVSRKRFNLNDRPSDDDDESSSFHVSIHSPPCADVTDSILTTPPRKIPRADLGEARESESGILESLRRFHREEMVSGEEMTELITLSDGVDLNFADSA